MVGSQPVESESSKRWRHAIRRVEFDTTMKYIPMGRDSTVLELGSGDGYQLEFLRRRFNRVFAIDPEQPPDRASGFVFSVAEALPFPDDMFDLVYSCCVAEHLKDRTRTVDEAARVLRPGGYMVHIVPTRLWKATGLIFHPVGYPIYSLETLHAMTRLPQEQREAKWERGPGVLRGLGWWFYPPIHGEYSSHLAEYSSYARKRWVEVLKHPRLECPAVIPLLYYSPFGLLRSRCLSLRVWLAKHGFASSLAIVLKKVERVSVSSRGAL